VRKEERSQLSIPYLAMTGPRNLIRTSFKMLHPAMLMAWRRRWRLLPAERYALAEPGAGMSIDKGNGKRVIGYSTERLFAHERSISLSKSPARCLGPRS